MTRILVTGGDGYIGRHLCLSLSLTNDVHILDNFSFGLDGRSHYQGQRITIHHCDIRESDRVNEVIDSVNPEIVFHLAAIHFIPQCEKTPDVTLATNVIGTINILRAVKDGTRIIFTSSGAVYAPDSNSHFEDTSVLGPTEIYGLAKLHGEHYVEYYTRLKQLKTTIVRLFNVIGPGETNPHILPVIIAQLLKDNRIIRLGNVKPKRDYIYIEDVVEGFVAIGFMGEMAIEHGKVLNLGTSQAYSVEEIVVMLSEIIDENISIKVDPRRVRKIDRPILRADITKITRLTGWSPKYSIQAALEETWKNPEFRIPG